MLAYNKNGKTAVSYTVALMKFIWESTMISVLKDINCPHSHIYFSSLFLMTSLDTLVILFQKGLRRRQGPQLLQRWGRLWRWFCRFSTGDDAIADHKRESQEGFVQEIFWSTTFSLMVKKTDMWHVPALQTFWLWRSKHGRGKAFRRPMSVT